MKEHAQMFDVWQWPEWIAFAKRLGIAMELPTTGIMIHMPIQGVIKITHDYIGVDVNKESNS